MKSIREEIGDYLDLWRKAQKQFSEEENAVEKTQKIEDSNFENDPQDNCRNLYYLSLGIDYDQLFSEAKAKEDPIPDWDEEKDGFGKDLAKKLGDTKFTPNPVHFASFGADSDLRVTPNFTDGKDLRELAKMKELLYDLESELMGADVRGEKTNHIRKKLNSVKKQCDKLSQKLIPDPKKDVS